MILCNYGNIALMVAMNNFKSTKIRFTSQQLVRAKSEEKSNLCITCAFGSDSTGDGGFPHRGAVIGKAFPYHGLHVSWP